MTKAVEASDSLIRFDWTSAAPMPISLNRKANPVNVQTIATRPYAWGSSRRARTMDAANWATWLARRAEVTQATPRAVRPASGAVVSRCASAATERRGIRGRSLRRLDVVDAATLRP